MAICDESPTMNAVRRQQRMVQASTKFTRTQFLGGENSIDAPVSSVHNFFLGARFPVVPKSQSRSKML